MLWILSGCFMGALGALFHHFKLPYVWLNIAGVGLVVVGVVLWLKDAMGAAKRSSSDSGFSADDASFDSSGDSGGGDGGGGGD